MSMYLFSKCLWSRQCLEFQNVWQKPSGCYVLTFKLRKCCYKAVIKGGGNLETVVIVFHLSNDAFKTKFPTV